MDEYPGELDEGWYYTHAHYLVRRTELRLDYSEGILYDGNKVICKEWKPIWRYLKGYVEKKEERLKYRRR